MVRISHGDTLCKENFPINYSDPLDIDLSGRRLDQLPKELESLADKVRTLVLSGNCFVRLPYGLQTHFPSLETLDLHGNPLNEIPNLSTLTKLRVLVIDTDRLSFVRDWLDQSSITRLHLVGRELASLPDWFLTTCSHIECFNNGTPLEHDFY